MSFRHIDRQMPQIEILLFFFNHAADGAFCFFMAARRAVFASKQNHLQMDFAPIFFGKQFFEIALNLSHVFSFAEPPSLRTAMDVRIDGKRRLMKGMT